MVSTRYGAVTVETLSLTKRVFKATKGLSVSWLSVECSKLAVRTFLTIELFKLFSSLMLEDMRKDAYF